MKLIDCFYLAKPFIPRRMQIHLRRALASRKRKAMIDTWPINPATAKAPIGWSGWPEGKEFALILLHDVDTAKGFRQCLQLMNIEKQLGFRSSFNFVPEGYTVTKSVRDQLTGSGFEVGVHGLKHDGKLFKHRTEFDKRALRINGYLEEWRAVGFTSPSMLRNLSWIAELNIEYSCSTFDTDPFEPQNDAAGTIFPFMVRDGDNTRAYVEIPYTLPQDHCLFVLLKESDISIWTRKLDWIAENGGFALLISHPDYMNFDGTKCSLEAYPISHYIDFLGYIKSKYSGRYWHPLPRELARFWREVAPGGLD